MKNWLEYKKIFLISIIGIPAAVITTILITYLTPEKTSPEILKQFMIQINPLQESSYSGTLIITDQSNGYLHISGKKKKIKDLYFTEQNSLRFNATIDKDDVQFSSHLFETRDNSYKGIIIGLNGEKKGSWSAQPVNREN
jgi:hypothetical protein